MFSSWPGPLSLFCFPRLSCFSQLSKEGGRERGGSIKERSLTLSSLYSKPGELRRTEDLISQRRKSTGISLHPKNRNIQRQKMDKQNLQTEKSQITECDLSEQIKAVTKESHVRAENTQLMSAFQKGQISLPQYKLMLCSLYKIYEALEEELDRNSTHESVTPIYFPQELARLESVKKDLEHFYGPDWKEKIVVPSATLQYSQRLREIGRENPEYLVAHAYTRYLGDLSGGQVLGRIAQKSLELKNGEGLSFFSFPAVSSPNLFKQLYRSRMNSIELTKEQREGVLKEAVRAFELNIEVFDGLQNLLNISEKDGMRQRHKTHSTKSPDTKKALEVALPASMVSSSHLLRMLFGVFVAFAVGMGIYAF